MIKLKTHADLEITPEIKLPNIAEQLSFPFMSHADMDYAYSQANSDLKHILDQVPLKNNRKYVTVRVILQHLTPNIVTVPRASWHFDSGRYGEGFENEECHTHLLISDCSAMTEFAENEVIIPDLTDYRDHAEIEMYMNKTEGLFVPKVCPANRFITFTGAHPHRATRPTQKEFRLMIRVVESDFVAPIPREKMLTPVTYVYVDNHDLTQIDKDYVYNKKIEPKPSIAKQPDGRVVIFNY